MKTATKRCALSKSEREARGKKIISFLILLIVCALWILPLLYMVGTSFKTTTDIMNNPASIFPSAGNWTWEHYVGFFQMKGDRIDDLPIWVINSIAITSIQVILSVSMTVFAAYSFVFLRFKGSKFIMAVIIASMTIPGVIGLVPSYTLFVNIGRDLQLNESIVYVFFWIMAPGLASAFNLLIMINAYKAIPKEIAESARSDGASEWRIFWKITTPLVKSTIVVIALFSFSGSWNALEWPQLLLSGYDTTYKTITVAIVAYTSNQGIDYKGLAMATCVFAMMPTFIIYLIAQNRIVEGLANTGVKQ